MQNWFGGVANISGMVACSDRTDLSTDTDSAVDPNLSNRRGFNLRLAADSTAMDRLGFNKQMYVASDVPAADIWHLCTWRFQ